MTQSGTDRTPSDRTPAGRAALDRDAVDGVVVRDGREAARANGRDAREGREAAGDGRRGGGGMDPLFGVRTADIEPYTGLRYLSKLFRMIAVVLVLLLVAEVATGLYTQGADALSTLLAEVSRLIVLAGLLWGAGDLAILLIDVGHDVRAARILLSRQVHHGQTHGAEGHARPADRADRLERVGPATAVSGAAPAVIPAAAGAPGEAVRP